jgi:hypothetical protein
VSSPASGHSPGAAALDRLLADDYTPLNPSGEMINKAQEVADTQAPAFASTVESLRTEDVEVSLSGSSEMPDSSGDLVVYMPFQSFRPL